MNEIEINFIKTEDYYDLSVMVGELLNEIMQKINIQAFNYNQAETEKRAKSLIERKKYWVFLAKEQISRKNVGFVSMYHVHSYRRGEVFEEAS